MQKDTEGQKGTAKKPARRMLGLLRKDNGKIDELLKTALNANDKAYNDIDAGNDSDYKKDMAELSKTTAELYKELSKKHEALAHNFGNLAKINSVLTAVSASIIGYEDLLKSSMNLAMVGVSTTIGVMASIVAVASFKSEKRNNEIAKARQSEALYYQREYESGDTVAHYW